MASPTWWTWDWVNSRSWWWTERPGVLLFMGSQRVGHSWATELNSLDALMLLIRTRKWYSKGRDLKLWKVTLREYDDSQYDLEKKKKKRRGGCSESENNHQSNCVCFKGWQTMTHGPNLASHLFFVNQVLWKHVKQSEVKLLSYVWLFATPWTVAYQAPLFIGFSRQ